MKKTVLISLVSLIVFCSCQKDDSNSPTENNSALKSAIVEQNNSFSFDIFNQILTNDGDTCNVFISPLSIYYALGMAAVGADGNTHQEFVDVLGWESASDTAAMEAMQELYNELISSSSGIESRIANSLWQNKDYTIYDTYKSNIETYFGGEVTNLDFTDASSVDVINTWIEDKTNNKIKDMLDAISSDAVMYLINAIYFKGSWASEFDSTETFDDVFYKADGSEVTASYMNHRAGVKYLNNDDFTAIRLPYVDSAYSMILILPDESFGMDGLLSELTMDNWETWMDEMAYQNVNIYIPKFKFSYGTRTLNNELISLGLNDAFSEINADFSKISPYDIYISRILHKSFIEVNEEGSEAAAATIIEYDITSIEGDETTYPTFRTNRPFIFSICEESTNTILFMGKVAYPEQ